MTEKSENQPVLISGPGGIPGFQCGERHGLFLNLCLDVETDDMTYHLTSIFTEKAEMGEVIDIIELERNQRQTA